MKTWNRERKRTRDRLLNYYINNVINTPYINQLNTVYPWTNQSLGILQKQFYDLALQHGFTDTNSNLWQKLLSNASVYIDTLANFPIHGQDKALYLDNTTNILYYFRQTTNKINLQIAQAEGIQIVGNEVDEITNNIITYMYIPVRAMPIQNLIYNSGDAAEYID